MKAKAQLQESVSQLLPVWGADVFSQTTNQLLDVLRADAGLFSLQDIRKQLEFLEKPFRTFTSLPFHLT